MNKSIDFYFDFISPYSYLAYKRIKFIDKKNELKINLLQNNGKDIEWMENIGSASNYLYLHIAFFFALHQVSREMSVPWLPHFLILDQPSSPYGIQTDDDKTSFNAVLVKMDKFIDFMKSQSGMQLIVMEKIKHQHWLDLELKNFHLVDEEMVGEIGLIMN